MQKPSDAPVGAPVRTKRVGTQLSPERIVDASLRIAARGGSDAFTIRKLGEELGADPTAVYRHFRDKDELLLSVADRMFGEVLDQIPDGLGWKDRLRALAAASLASALKYPVVASAVVSRTTRRVNEFRIVELILGAVVEAGLDGDEAVVHYRMFGDSVLAFTGQRASFLLFEPEVRASDEAAWGVEYRRADRRVFPRIARLGRELEAVTLDDVYHARIEALIGAIERRAQELRQA